MPDTITSPNMNMVLPVPQVRTGPNYANDINSALYTVVDGHDHTSSKGVKVPTAGININADLDFQHFNATNVRSTRFDNQVADIAGSSDRNAIYFKNGTPWYIDNVGDAYAIGNATAAGVAGDIQMHALSGTGLAALGNWKGIDGLGRLRAKAWDDSDGVTTRAGIEISAGLFNAPTEYFPDYGFIRLSSAFNTLSAWQLLTIINSTGTSEQGLIGMSGGRLFLGDTSATYPTDIRGNGITIDGAAAGVTISGATPVTVTGNAAITGTLTVGGSAVVATPTNFQKFAAQLAVTPPAGKTTGMADQLGVTSGILGQCRYPMIATTKFQNFRAYIYTDSAGTIPTGYSVDLYLQKNGVAVTGFSAHYTAGAGGVQALVSTPVATFADGDYLDFIFTVNAPGSGTTVNFFASVVVGVVG